MQRQTIEAGQTVLGIELGSTRIKAVLTDASHAPIATGEHVWENQLLDGYWTYGETEIWQGLRACYRDLAHNVQTQYGVALQSVGAMGVSAMMHGYLALDAQGALLTPFRTWRNSTTGEAAEELTALFDVNIPQRWSIAHLYQAMLNGEAHVRDIASLTTLAGYIHWRLTGQAVLGIGDASGMFPVDPATGDYDAGRMAQFDALAREKGYAWRLRDLLPRVLPAGAQAGVLSQAGARLLDEDGALRPGIPLCPPEGDAGTGMVATGSVRPRTGNVSAGTSVFAMVVLERPLSHVHREIDLVTTPDGSPVAMVHANNCTSDLNAWVGLFGEFAQALGTPMEMGALYELLYRQALAGDADGGGLLAYGYLSGENITGVEQGRPLFMRTPQSRFTLKNFMRTHLFAALGALRLGMDILRQEDVRIDAMLGHGGFFKTPGVGQRLMAAAIEAPVSVMQTAGEGGPWGMALLAAYMLHGAQGESLADYLQQRVFSAQQADTLRPDPQDVKGFAAFMQRYRRGLAIEQMAAQHLL